MTTPETPIAAAAHHVAEAEMRVLRQAAVLSDLGGAGADTAEAEELLRTLQAALDAWRATLRVEQDRQDA